MNNITITSLENNLEIIFSEHFTTEYCPYGIADFLCIKVDFKNIKDQKEYVYIDGENEVCYIKLDKDNLIKLKHLFQNTYKKAMKENVLQLKNFNKNQVELTLMEDDTNLYLCLIGSEVYFKIDAFIGNIIESVNIFPYQMKDGYNFIFNFLNKQLTQ